MEVQHHIQHTLASFSAFLPPEASLRVGRFGKYEYVCGEYALRREVFADYYRPSRTNGVEHAPHLSFAKSDNSLEGILNFTYNWGPLSPNLADDSLLRFAFDTKERPNPENFFAFYVGNWRASQKRFADAVQSAANDNVEAVRWLLPYRQPAMGPIKSGALYPYIDTGTPIEVLERHWMADGRMTKDEVRRTARHWRIFFPEKGGPRYQLVFEAASLMDAFWHMLFIDLTVRRPMIRICANPRCMQTYRAGRSNQMYCGSDCAKKAANLEYYHRKGKERRRSNRRSSRTSSR